jgi:hypothetical protein
LEVETTTEEIVEITIQEIIAIQTIITLEKEETQMTKTNE